MSATFVTMVIGTLSILSVVFSSAIVVDAFLPITSRTSFVKLPTTETSYLSPSSKLHSNNPFFADVSSKSSSSSTTDTPKPKEDTTPSPPAIRVDPSFDPNPDALIAKARVVLATDFGIQDPSILAEDFLWIRPFAEKPLGKIDYLAAGKFFDLRSTFPDLDYRAHDFRIDTQDPLTVRCTSRPVGTMRGPLRLRNEVVDANGKILRGPPEAISMTFEGGTGKLQKLCSEFVMDRQVGNTNGLSGVKAAATVAGVPPSDWEVYPVSTVVSRFFGRPMEPIKEPTTFLAPFPETVMISLAKGVLFAKLGAEDPSLLAKNFAFLTPTVGPIGKNKFVESYAAEQFGEFEGDYLFNNYRVDPYDPYRVWVDVKLLGSGLEGPPQAWSFTFDDDGFCTRITGGAIMDPSIGNTGGLAGIEGIQYALGEGSPDITTRPLPLALGRLKKTLIAPITKIEADAFVLEKSEKVASKVPVPKEDAATAKKRILEQAKAKIEMAETAKREAKERAMAAKAKAALPIPPPPPPPVPKPPTVEPPIEEFAAVNIPKVELPNVNLKMPKIDLPWPTLEIPKVQPMQTPPKKAPSSPKEEKQRAAASTSDRLDMIRRKQEEARERMAAEAEKKRAIAEEARQKRIEAQRQKREQMEEQARAQAEATRKQEEQRIALAKKNAEERRRKLEEQRQAQIAARKKQEEERQLAEKASAAKKQKTAQAKKPAAPRPSFQLPRPSLSIPKPSVSSPTATPKVEKRPSFSLPRPSLTIPKPVEKTKPAEKAPSKKIEKRPSFSLPRPSLQIPQPTSSSQSKSADVKTKTVQKRPSFALFQPAKLNVAPKGVPTVVAWKVRSDGGIAGQVFGSINFKEGQQFETSPIVKGEIENGSVVQTASGSRYFLSDKTVQQMKQLAANSAPVPKDQFTAPPRATIELTQKAKQERAAKAIKVAEKAPPGATISLSSIFGFSDDDSQKSVPSKKPAPKPVPPPKADKFTVSNSSPTFSLGSIFGTESQSSSTKAAPKTATSVKKEAPKGVPTIERWNVGSDKAVTGFIRGSSQFQDGEKVTTSPISKGNLKSGEVVVTSSGTRYFLK